MGAEGWWAALELQLRRRCVGLKRQPPVRFQPPYFHRPGG